MPVPRSFIRGPAATGANARKDIQSREDFVRKDLTLRLKCVCANLSSAEFEVLVGDMTREQLRGERIPGKMAGPF